MDLSTSRVLVQERLVGVSVADRANIARAGVDEVALADRLVMAMTRHMLTDGHFHADPHPGNVMLLEDGDLGLIDFGATGRIDPLQRAALLEMTLAVLRNDAAALREGIEQVTVIKPETSDVALERALRRFMADNLAEGGALGAAAFGELMPLLATFEIEVPAELTTFFRALALLDGTVRTIHPGYSLIDGMRRLFDPRATAASASTSRKDQLLDMVLRDVPRLQRLPAKIDRIANVGVAGELRTRVSLLSGAEDVLVLTRLVNRCPARAAGQRVGPRFGHPRRQQPQPGQRAGPTGGARLPRARRRLDPRPARHRRDHPRRAELTELPRMCGVGGPILDRLHTKLGWEVAAPRVGPSVAADPEEGNRCRARTPWCC